MTSLPFPRAAQPRDNRTWPRTPNCRCIPPPHPEHAEDLLRLLAAQRGLRAHPSPLLKRRRGAGGRRLGAPTMAIGAGGAHRCLDSARWLLQEAGVKRPSSWRWGAGVAGEGSGIQNEVVKRSPARVPRSPGADVCSLLGYVDHDDFQPRVGHRSCTASLVPGPT